MIDCMNPSRASSDGLGDTVEVVVDVDRSRQRLHGTLAHEDDPEDEGDGNEDVEQGAGDVDPEVPDRGGVAPGEAPHHGDGHRDADGGAHELLEGQRADLGEVRHGRLAAVVLPVGVGHERGGRVEAESRGHRPRGAAGSEAAILGYG